MAMRASCTHCGADFMFPESLAGSDVTCTKCGKAFRVQTGDAGFAASPLPAVSDRSKSGRASTPASVNPAIPAMEVDEPLTLEDDAPDVRKKRQEGPEFDTWDSGVDADRTVVRELGRRRRSIRKADRGSEVQAVRGFLTTLLETRGGLRLLILVVGGGFVLIGIVVSWVVAAGGMIFGGFAGRPVPAPPMAVAPPMFKPGDAGVPIRGNELPKGFADIQDAMKKFQQDALNGNMPDPEGLKKAFDELRQANLEAMKKIAPNAGVPNVGVPNAGLPNGGIMPPPLVGNRPLKNLPVAGPGQSFKFAANSTEVVVGAMKFKELLVQTENVQPCIHWSADGKACYILEKQGKLHRIDYREFKHSIALELPSRNCEWMCESGEGLLVAMRDQGVAVVDPGTWTLKRTIAVPKMKDRVTAGTGSSFAFASIAPFDLAVIDLKAGAVVRTHGPREFGQPFCFAGPTATRDGKFLFAEGFNKLHRFAISPDGRLELQEQSDMLAFGPAQPIALSPDDQFVSLFGAGGTIKIKGGGLAVFRASDLKNPAFRLKKAPGGSFQAIVLGAKGVRAFGQTRQEDFAMFDQQGNKLIGFGFGAGPANTRQIAPRQDESHFLVLTRNRLFRVESTQ